MYQSVAEIVEQAEKKGCPIWQLMVEQEMEYSNLSFEEVWLKMKKQLAVMKNAAKRGSKGEVVQTTRNSTEIPNIIKERKVRTTENVKF